MAATDAKAIPIYGQPFRLYFWCEDAAGVRVASVSSPDSEVSLDDLPFIDCADEIHSVGKGKHYIDLNATEMSANHVGYLLTGSNIVDVKVDIYPMDPTQAVPANLIQIDGDPTETGTAQLTLRSLSLVGINEPGLSISTDHVDSPGLFVRSRLLSGTQPAILAQGGYQGAGVEFQGGSVAGSRSAGLIVSARAGNNHGLLAEGKGSGNGMRIESLDTGNGVMIAGGATATNNGHALRLTTRSGDAYGIYVTASGAHDGIRSVGGATGHGIHAIGGATSGSGIRGAAATSGDGMTLIGVGAGNYDLRAGTSTLIASIEDGVLDALVADHQAAGSIGEAISDAAAGGGGGGGDCLENQVPGSYDVGSAGWVLGRMGSARVDVVSPVNLVGDQITIVRGDDYASADGRALEWQTSDAATWPDLTSATIQLTVKYGAGSTTYSGSVVTPTGVSKKVRVELTAAQTGALVAQEYDWDLQATLSGSGRKVTLRRGKAYVLEHFTP